MDELFLLAGLFLILFFYMLELNFLQKTKKTIFLQYLFAVLCIIFFIVWFLYYKFGGGLWTL